MVRISYFKGKNELKYFKMIFISYVLFHLMPNQPLYGLSWAGGTRETITISSINIRAITSTVKIGDPLILRVSCNTIEHQLPESKPEIPKAIPHNMYATITNGSDSTVDKYIMYPNYLTIQDPNRLVYEHTYALFFNVISGDFLFKNPGSYKLKVHVRGKISSNEITINLLPAGTQNQKAISLLTDPEDLFFIFFGKHRNTKLADNEKTLMRLEQVVEECQGTTLSRLSAARLGLKYMKDFRNEHSKFYGNRVKNNTFLQNDTQYNKACEYLAIGKQLPSVFKIHEEVLYQSAITEIMTGDLQKVHSLFDELNLKHPLGRYSKKASKGRKELIKFQQKEKNETP